MEALVYLTPDGHPATNSQLVARLLGLPYREVETLCERLGPNAGILSTSTFLDGANRTRKVFTLNRRGFEALAKNFRSQKATRVKRRLNQGFDQLEAQLRAAGQAPVPLTECADPQKQVALAKQVAEQLLHASADTAAVIHHHSTILRILTGHSPRDYVRAAAAAGLCSASSSARAVLRQLEPAKAACSLFLDDQVNRGLSLEKLVAAGVPQAMTHAFSAMLRAGINPELYY